MTEINVDLQKSKEEAKKAKEVLSPEEMAGIERGSQ